MKELQRQDIKTMIDRLDTISTGDGIEDHIINNAITMLEDLGNLVNKLQLENANLKQELKDINRAIDDPAVDLIITASEAIIRLKKELDFTKRFVL